MNGVFIYNLRILGHAALVAQSEHAFFFDIGFCEQNRRGKIKDASFTYVPQ